MTNWFYDEIKKDAAASPAESARAVIEEEDILLDKSRSAALKGFLREIGLLCSMVKDYVSGAYRKVPTRVIVAATAALLYVISPIDAVPDILPGLGLLDDAAVVAFVIGQLRQELNSYSLWKRGGSTAV